MPTLAVPFTLCSPQASGAKLKAKFGNILVTLRSSDLLCKQQLEGTVCRGYVFLPDPPALLGSINTVFHYRGALREQEAGNVPPLT